MISNVLINLIAMITLAMIITNIVSNYIEKDIKKDLIKENQILVKLFSYNKFLVFDSEELTVNLDYYKKINDLPIIRAVSRIDKDPKILAVVPNKIKNILNENEMNYILEQDVKKEYNITVNGKTFLAYNDQVKVNYEGEVYSLLVTTLLPNAQIKEISGQIVKALIASIILISILLAIVTSYNGRKITKPIEILESTTEKIANRNFDEKAIVKTGDEIEGLAIAINSMAESLKRQDVEQKKFYENISHELKTPLTVISGYAQGIKTNIFEDNEKSLDTIIEVSMELKKQLEDIIYLSKLDTVNEFYHFENTSINELISNGLEKLDSIIIINDIDIIYEPTQDVILSIDKDKVSRMFINVLSNCIKYTKGIIEIKNETTKNWFRIVVSDNGKGFSENVLKAPFSRTQVGEKEGSGIGLSIIKKIVDGHGGNIKLTNQKNGGAVYTIELPLKRKLT